MKEKRQYYIISLLIVFSLTFGILFFTSIDETEAVVPVGNKERPYYFRVELSQWSIKVIDLNRIEDMMLEGYSKAEAFSKATYVDKLEQLEKGSRVFLQIYSLDVLHGLKINELDISISILDITNDIDSTIPLFYDFLLPNSDTSVTAYCQVYCGFGHSYMKFKFSIGDGSSSNGTFLFRIFVVLTMIIAFLFLSKMNSHLKRQVFLSDVPPNSSHSKKSASPKYFLYDISKLTPKEIVALRQGYLDISKNGQLLLSFRKQTLEEVMAQISSNNDYKLIT